MSGLRRILWQRLDTDMKAALGPEWTNKKLIIYGAGGLGLSFMQTFARLSIAYAIDSDLEREGEFFHGLSVEKPDFLRNENLDDIVVFITSSWHQEISGTLESLGLTKNRHFFFGNQQAHGRIFFYLRDMSDFSKAFAWFDERGTDYAILRWFETLPEETPGDIDLLVRTSDLEQLFENPYLTNEPVGVPLEVYWSSPLGQEDELLYYPAWLANQILSSRRKLSSGAFAPSDDCYLKSLAYHVVFHKAERTGWPTVATEGPIELPNKYLDKIKELSESAGIDLDLTLEGMWKYLDSVGWLPPIDLARRYAVSLKSPWLTQKVGRSPQAHEDVLIFVFREWLLRHPDVLEEVCEELEGLGLRQIDLVELSNTEKEIAYAQIRGGNWVETEASREGGGPAAFGVFFDPSVEEPTEQDRLLRPFCTNRKLTEKTDLKQRICKQHNNGVIVNFLHAADDDREGMEYLDCLDPGRRQRLVEEISAFRKDARGRS